jgi:hypothetical protein
MTIFGKKFDHGFTRFANKVKHTDFHKFANKVAHGVHKGLAVASKVIAKVDDVAARVVNASGQLEGVPIIGGLAGVVNVGAKQIRSVTKVAKAGVATLGRMTDTGAKTFGDSANNLKNKGVAGLEKKIQQGLDTSKQISDGVTRARDAYQANPNPVANSNPLTNKM